MKKFRYIIPAAISIMLMAAGCSKNKDFGEEYNPDYDYQYTYMDSFVGRMNIQSSAEGEYIYYDGFIYFFNEGIDELYPLCSRANCLHDKETDADKIKECNAYTDMEYNACKSIAYYDGCIYYYEEKTEQLYRVSADGRKKEAIFSMPEDTVLIRWNIHRGYFYYYIVDYPVTEDNEVVRRANIKRLRLENNMKDKKAEIIYQSKDEISVYNVDVFLPYKDYLYFSVRGKDISNESDDVLHNMTYDLFCYDTEQKSLERIVIDDIIQYEEDTVISNIVPFDGRLLLQVYNMREEEAYEVPLYITDADFKNTDVFLESIQQGRIVHSYIDKVIIPKTWMADFQYEGDCIEAEVYNANAELVDTFIYPLSIYVNLRGCGRNGKILEFTSDDENWYIKGFDLNTVGNYNGAVVELEDMAEREKRKNN